MLLSGIAWGFSIWWRSKHRIVSCTAACVLVCLLSAGLASTVQSLQPPAQWNDVFEEKDFSDLKKSHKIMEWHPRK